RTLYDIIWSSLVTILACVWTAVHRNIPGPSQGRLSRTREMTKVLVITLLMPEWVLAWAIRQFLNAPWIAKGWEGRAEWTTVHGFFVIMGGFHYYEGGNPKQPLSPTDVLELVKSGDLVPPTEDEIAMWSQADVLSKAISVVQTFWFVVQCIARRVEGLPISQLELMTIAYTTITIAMYLAWWQKPLNVSGSIRVAGKVLPERTPELDEEWYERVLGYAVSWRQWPGTRAEAWRAKGVTGRTLFVLIGFRDVFVDMRKHPRVPTFYGGTSSATADAPVTRVFAHTIVADHVALVVAMVFGAVHCVAWNYAFPSYALRLVWRLSAAAIVAAPAGAAVSMVARWIVVRLSGVGQESPLRRYIILGQTGWTVVAGALYLTARILLMALSFVALRSLPAEAYQTVQWTFRIPHL
ncbi:hypothetical protein BV25DRAFT_1769394, partial [Artomyces pyxidatus]